MIIMEETLLDLEPGVQGTVARFAGTPGFMRKLRTIGIREGKTLVVVARHPLGGPVVVEVDGREVTLGRGMAERVIVDVTT
ncbi:ferrous iron transport protein A [Methanoculleus bourgensis]|jgi:ferrous iron transport protein A|uniref:Ferrous iron transport protein A n=2 Tax=Methanoculleus bourgensis TaxID=83986 RepID=A0A110BIP1_9EURY|nr:FeoA family protein [Methanoculleus sp. UBA413]MBT0732640.1 ferrous iron transport protein A [Methanoculleus bourgensis]NMA89511.1 ferrous iron transport protein A [Methanoculleus bourgensis]NQS78325.1 ferrous iron transport protein A [Methanoculleus bourgensis]CVK34701.1 Ferrous iron transport protein A [Methanoculleus bourgensis]SAI89382.1 ferrous iron transport protein A [Methanoculleus bourgensis]